MSTSTITVSEDAIRIEAERMIRQTAEKHGVTRNELKDEAIQDAYNTAKERLHAEAERKANPYFQERESLRQENERLKLQLDVAQSSRPATSQQPGPRQTTVDEARARAGEYKWNIAYTDAERLAAIGISPEFNTPSNRAECRELFAAGADSGRAADLMKSNPARYRQLREFGRAVRIL